MSEFEILNNGAENNETEATVLASSSQPEIVEAQIISETAEDNAEPVVESVSAPEPAPQPEPAPVREPESAPAYAHTEYTNEYVYTPDAPAKKQTNAGRVILGIVAALLSILKNWIWKVWSFMLAVIPWP